MFKKYILFLFFLTLSLKAYENYDPFIYNFETRKVKNERDSKKKAQEVLFFGKVDEKLIDSTDNFREINIQNNLTQVNNDIQKTNTKNNSKELVSNELSHVFNDVSNDVELDFFKELNEIKPIVPPKAKSVKDDELLNEIELYEKALSNKGNKERRLLVDKNIILSSKRMYYLLYEDTKIESIKEKTRYHNINSGIILKNKNNKEYGIIIDTSLYDINKVKSIYKYAKLISIDEIKSKYIVNKNYF